MGGISRIEPLFVPDCKRLSMIGFHPGDSRVMSFAVAGSTRACSFSLHMVNFWRRWRLSPLSDSCISNFRFHVDSLACEQEVSHANSAARSIEVATRDRHCFLRPPGVCRRDFSYDASKRIRLHPVTQSVLMRHGTRLLRVQALDPSFSRLHVDS